MKKSSAIQKAPKSSSVIVSELLNITDANKVMEAVVEQKITRSELLDIVITQTKEKLDTSIEELRARRMKLEESCPVPAEAIAVAARAHLSDALTHLARRDGYVKLTLPISRLPRKWQKALDAHQASIQDISDRLSSLYSQRNKFDAAKSQGRVKMLMLQMEQTPEGRHVLSAIEQVAASVRKQLGITP